jgi:hypothetical protein
MYLGLIKFSIYNGFLRLKPNPKSRSICINYTSTRLSKMKLDVGEVAQTMYTHVSKYKNDKRKKKKMKLELAFSVHFHNRGLL